MTAFAALTLQPFALRAAFQTVCAAGCSFTTITLAYAGAASGDTLVLKQDFAENATFATSGKNINVTSDSVIRTWDGSNDANPTLNITVGGTTTFVFSNLIMNRSSTNGGYTVFNNNNGNGITKFYNVTLKRSSASATSNSIYQCNTCNNNNQLIALSRCALVGTGGGYGIRVETANNNNPVVMANCSLGGFSNAGFPALYINKTDQTGGQQVVNCTFYNNSVAIKYGYNGANTNANSYTQNCLFIGNSTDVTWNLGTGNAKQFYKYNTFTQLAYDPALGTGNLFGTTPANEVVNPTSGSEDLHLIAGAWSINNGFGLNATSDDFFGTAKAGVRDIGATEFTGLNCVGGAKTVYLANQLMNPVTGTSKYLDLVPVAAATSNGLGSPAETALTQINYPASATSQGDFVFHPTTAYSPNPSSSPGASSKGFGFMLSQVLPNDIAAGTWTFSNRFQGNIAQNPVIKHRVAVYAWDPSTGLDSFLFTDISPTDMAPSITGFGKFTSSFSSVQPGFSGLAGKYLKIEVYANITSSGPIYAGGSVYLGFNTAADFVTYPGSNCGSPTNTPTISPSPTATPTFTITQTFTDSPTPSVTVTPSSTPSPSSTITPSMPLVKSSNVAAANLGDTVTYTFSYTNDSSASADFSIWDTLPAQIGFIGCDNGCTQIGGIVKWTQPSVPAGTSGTVNFWGVINGYPWLPGRQDWQTVEVPWRPGWRRGGYGLALRRA